MGKLGLVIADTDENYLGRLGNYLMVNYSGRFNIHLFSSCEKLSLFLKSAVKRPDILLYSQFFSKEALMPEMVHTIIQLSDNNPSNPVEGVNAIFKYRHTESLVQDILHIYSRSCMDTFIPDGKTTAGIYAVHAASGGAGTTSIAAGLSMMAARRGLKSLYLNFESMSSTSFYFKGGSERTFSDVIYYLKENGVNLAAKLEGGCCCDPSSGVRYFLPPDSACEMEELTEGDIGLFLRTMRSSPMFDVVFIDLPSGLSRRNNYILKYCDKIINVCAYRALPLFKKSMMEGDPGALGADEKNEFSSRSFRILNRYLDDVPNDWRERDYNDKFRVLISESDKLRFNSGEKLLIDVDPTFSASIGKLLDFLVAGGKGEGGGYGGGVDFA